ncbi:hypothetical protein TK90_1100 [Thioalkalivibrio sp. K90mix]|uniref:hypothetical protein n=1 Tax=Thioalkalivibrio sp. (strain K90mix) TaxID=396595 RepID=UPI000195A4BE|nr:hypothetical protein [Thioalkalivibrio sp. K90mix]ADC71612.1 hypothetical protein TK90_1100 [Thioalkalivibrio sp. K90mix]
MWMMVGIVTLIGMAILFYRQRLEDRWKPVRLSPVDPMTGQRRERPPEDALYNSRDRRHLAPFERVGFHRAPDVGFRAKRRRWWDVVFTAIGLSVACRTGNRAFDRAFHLVSDQDSICRALKGCEKTQSLMLQILELCRIHGYRFRQLRVCDQQVWVEVVSLWGHDSLPAPELMRTFLPTLRELSAALDAEIPEAARGRGDRFAWKAALMTGISTALLITGVVHFAGRIYVPLPGLVAPGTMVPLALVSGAVIVGALIALTIAWMGRTSRTHLVVLELVLVGFIGASITSFTLAREANMTLDFSPPELHVVEVLDKSYSPGYRHTSYYLWLEGWDGAVDRNRIRVGRSLYNEANKGGQLLLKEYPGLLGFPWVRLEVSSHNGVGPR